jgi:hypothetical protein
MKRYRIIESTYYNRGESKNSTHYEIQVFKKFLWISWWSSLKESYGEADCPITLQTLDEAQRLLERIRNGNPIKGWKEKVVMSDPEFQKINKK